MKRGEHDYDYHDWILFLNSLFLISTIIIIIFYNTDISLLHVLFGFSASILSLFISAIFDHKHADHHYYLIIPFFSVAIFVITGYIFLYPYAKDMDFETLAVLNLAFSFLFSILYYVANRKVTLEKHTPKIKKKNNEFHLKIKETENKKEDPSPKKEEKTNNIQQDHHKSDIHIYIEELKKEFNITNIDSKIVLDALKNFHISLNNKHDYIVNKILSRLDDKKIFFASVDGRKFHKPLCIVLNHIKKEKMTVFKDKNEAKSEGFKPCKICLPDLK